MNDPRVLVESDIHTLSAIIDRLSGIYRRNRSLITEGDLEDLRAASAVLGRISAGLSHFDPAGNLPTHERRSIQ